VLVGGDILEITIVLAGAHSVLRIQIFQIPGMRQLSPRYMAGRRSPPHPNHNFNRTKFWDVTQWLLSGAIDQWHPIRDSEDWLLWDR
jgi:hypothetical protein